MMPKYHASLHIRDINLLRKLSIISYRNTLYIRRIFRVAIFFFNRSTA